MLLSMKLIDVAMIYGENKTNMSSLEHADTIIMLAIGYFLNFWKQQMLSLSLGRTTSVIFRGARNVRIFEDSKYCQFL